MESARETVPAIPRDTIAELRHSLQQLKEEKELSEQKWMEERTSLEQEHKRTIERLESQVSELNGELRGRVNGEEMARLKNALVTLQRVGVPVNYREDSDIPVPDTESSEFWALSGLHHYPGDHIYHGYDACRIPVFPFYQPETERMGTKERFEHCLMT